MKSNTTITIADVEYLFIKDYRELKEYRTSLNELTKVTYGFDFEAWYQLGFWGKKYRPYSLVHQGRVIANVSANPIDFIVDGKEYHTLQIGTVMTDPAYRKKGLSRALMDILLLEYEATCDMIYLYANDSVLEFYPRFGFIEAEEYYYTKEVYQGEKHYSFCKLNGQVEQDRNLIAELVMSTKPISKYTMINNSGLAMFYLTSFMAENIYYCEALKLLAVAEYEEGKMKLIDLYCQKDFSLEEVINSLMTQPVMEVSLGFTPLSSEGFHCVRLKEAGTTFFVKGNNFVDKGRLPELSHA